jgi:ferredoxin-like protein FixX
VANRFPGPCRDCGAHVPAGRGNFHRTDGRFEVRCRICIDECSAARIVSPAITYEQWRSAKAKGIAA